MKKLLLSATALFLFGTLLAQNEPVCLTKEQASRLSVSVPLKATPNPVQISHIRGDVIPSSGIGQTYYDLQTNGSLPQRIVTYSDGTIATTWTVCGTSTSSRGSGYNYYNGSSWANASNSTDRIESVRAGWPTIAPVGTNGEIVVSHNGSTGLLVNVRAQKGTGTWSETVLTGPAATNSSTGATSTCLLWPSIATNGNTIHLLACTESEEGYLYQGISVCLLYYRGTYDESSNTVTWESPRVVGDMGNNTSWFNSFGGDNYVIAANGNTVAVAVSGQWSDSFLWKSTDNGTTFTTTNVVNSFIPDNFDDDVHLLDTANGPTYVTDGATAIAIDDSGKVHLAFGISAVNNPELGDGYITVYYAIDGLLYWNESMPTFPGTYNYQLDPDTLISNGYSVFGRADLDGDGSVWYSSAITYPENYHRIGMTSQPSLALNGNNVYLVYTSVLDMPFYDESTTGMYFRGIFGVKSTNGGTSFNDDISWLSYSKDCYYVDWSLYDWTSTSSSWTYESVVMESENIYPSVSQNVVNGKLNMIWHNDYFPDNAGGSIASNPTNVLTLTIDADQLGSYNNTVEIPQGLWIDYTGIADNTLQSMSIYPNPATTNAMLAVSTTESANATVTIFNLMGQMVYSSNVGLNEGNNLININVSDLRAGVYMVNVKTNKGTSTQKLIVK